MDTALIIIIIIFVIIIIVGLLLLMNGRKTSQPSPPSGDVPIEYLPEAGIGYRILMGDDIDITNIPKDDEFFAETYFVRDKVKNWNEMFEASHTSQLQTYGNNLTLVEEAMKRISDAMYTFITGGISVAPRIIERQPANGSPSNAAIVVYDDESTTVSRMDIPRVLPGLAALVDMDPTNVDLKNQLALAHATSVKPINSTVENASSIGGLVTPNGSTSFLSNNFFISNFNTGYEISVVEQATLNILDEIRQTDTDIEINYAYMIPFEDGGLEIAEYRGAGTRFVISNVWYTGTIKSYWHCYVDDETAPPPTIVCTAAMTNAGVRIKGSPNTLTVSENAVTLTQTEDDGESFFNIFDNNLSDEGIMYNAADGKYDPTRGIITSVYAGIGLIANLSTGKFAAQANLEKPSNVLDFTGAPFNFLFDSVNVGTINGSAITLPEGYTTAYGVLAGSTIEAIQAAIDSVEPHVDAVVVNNQ